MFCGLLEIIKKENADIYFFGDNCCLYSFKFTKCCSALNFATDKRIVAASTKLCESFKFKCLYFKFLFQFKQEY